MTRVNNRTTTKATELRLSDRMWKEYFDLDEKAVIKKVYTKDVIIGQTFQTLIDAAQGSELPGSTPAARLLKAKAPKILASINERNESRKAKQSATIKAKRAASTINLTAPAPKAKPKAKPAAKPTAKRTRKPKAA